MDRHNADRGRITTQAGEIDLALAVRCPETDGICFLVRRGREAEDWQALYAQILRRDGKPLEVSTAADDHATRSTQLYVRAEDGESLGPFNNHRCLLRRANTRHAAQRPCTGRVEAKAEGRGATAATTREPC